MICHLEEDLVGAEAPVAAWAVCPEVECLVACPVVESEWESAWAWVDVPQ